MLQCNCGQLPEDYSANVVSEMISEFLWLTMLSSYLFTMNMIKSIFNEIENK